MVSISFKKKKSECYLGISLSEMIFFNINTVKNDFDREFLI